jgi:hypothetical protein
MSDNEVEHTHPTLSRRKFLKILGAAAGVGTLAACKIVVVENGPTQTSIAPLTPTETNTPVQKTQLPDSQPIYEILQQTATAIAEKGEQTSFVEQAGFSKELFEKTRKGTFILAEIPNLKEGEKILHLKFGTAWLAQSKDDVHYFVTNKHVVEGFTNGEMRLWRPQIDKKPFTPGKIAYALHQNRDLAVVKCTGEYAPETPAHPLSWKDNHDLKAGEEALVVGYPTDFFTADVLGVNASTAGEVVTINKTFPDGWLAKASINGGSSGSSVVINNNGEPLVIGTAFARNDNVLDVDDTHTQKHPVVHVSELDIEQLINALKTV